MKTTARQRRPKSFRWHFLVPTVEQLESRCVPAGTSPFPVGGLAVGDVNGAGAPSLVSVSDPGTTTTLEVVYGGSFTNQAAFPSTVNSATAVQMPAGLALSQWNPGTATQSTQPLNPFPFNQQLFPFNNFSGGATVACGDFFGTGFDDIAVAAGTGGWAQIVIYSGQALASTTAPGPLAPVLSFFGIAPFTFSRGMTIAADVLDNTGKADLIVGAGPGGGPQVNIFTFLSNGSGGYSAVELASFNAFSPSYSGGVSVATGAILNSLNKGAQYVFVGQMSGSSPTVAVFDPSATPQFAPQQVGSFTVNNLPAGSSGVYVTADTQPWTNGLLVLTPVTGDPNGTVLLYAPSAQGIGGPWSLEYATQLADIGAYSGTGTSMALVATGFIFNNNPVLIARQEGSNTATAFCVDVNPFFYGSFSAYDGPVLIGNKQQAVAQLGQGTVTTQSSTQENSGFLQAAFYNSSVGTYPGGKVLGSTTSPYILATLPVNVLPTLQSVAGLSGKFPIVSNFPGLNFMTDTQRDYQSPYALTLPANAAQMYGINTDMNAWGPLSYDYSNFDAYGPSITQFSIPASVLANDSTFQLAERIIAAGTLMLGDTLYQHHHDPAFLGTTNLPPDPGFYFDPNDNMRQTPGIDCTDFTSLVYDLALGIQMTSATNAQSLLKTVDQYVGSANSTPKTVNTNLVNVPADHDVQGYYNQLIQDLMPGDILYISGTGPGQQSSTTVAAHGIIYLGTPSQGIVSQASDPDNVPLIMDCTGQEHTDANGVQIPNGVEIRPFEFQGANDWYFQDLVRYNQVLYPNAPIPVVPPSPTPSPSPSPSPSPTGLSLSSPLITPSAPGSLANLSGSISANPSSPLTLSVNWGDGLAPTMTTLAAGSLGYQLTHVYQNPGQFAVSVTVTDNLNNTATATTTAFVTANNILATGTGAGAPPQVNVYNSLTGALETSFDAFAPSFTGGVNVAVGDVNSDGHPDIICGAGAGGGPQVNVYDGVTFQLIRSFDAFASSFTGGVFVTAGDLTGNGYADIICGAGAGGGPQVAAFDGLSGQEVQSFYAFNSTFTGGVRVASATFGLQGHADIVAAAGPGGGPQVMVYDGQTLATLASFFAYSPTFSGGVYVAAGDVTGDGIADIVTGAGPGGGPQVNVFSNPVLIFGDPDGNAFPVAVSGVDANGQPNLKVQADGSTAPTASFYALGSTFTGGVRVGATASVQVGQLAIATAAGPGGGPQVTLFNGSSLAVLDSFFAYNANFTNGVFVS